MTSQRTVSDLKIKNVEKLIKAVQSDWAKAKAKAEARCRRAGKSQLAAKLAVCDMFLGIETLPELVSLMFSPQGIEFMTSFGFPDIETFRRFKPYNPERLGVYIDCGQITLIDERKVFLVGDTTAVLKYRQTARNLVNLMCGAKATIIASGYSVVKVESDRSSQAAHIVSDHAIVL